MVAPLIQAPAYAIVDATLVTLAPLWQRRTNLARVTEEDLGIVRGGCVVAENGKIVAAGGRAECAAQLRTVRERARERFEEIDVAGALVLPGFVDAHTHALFAGERIADFESIAAGETPTQGIRYTVEQTRECDESTLVRIGERHLRVLLAHGTTTAEIKSGYALNADGEARMLRAMRRLDERNDLPHVVATFCGAHALPPEFDDYDAFVDELIERILPAVRELDIARFADAFCELDYFTPAQCRRFLLACERAGMGLRLHAEELSASGGIALAAELRCASADHLNFAGEDGARRLAAAGCVAVLCPSTAEYLDLERWAPARAFLEHGVPVALATDFNPGTGPCCSLQTVAHLARRRLGMTAPEAIAGVTVQAARSLRLERTTGALVPGLRADLAVLGLSDYRAFGYYYGTNLIQAVALGV